MIFFTKLVSWISRMLSEDNGNPSQMRVSVIIHDIAIAICFLMLIGAAVYLLLHKLQDLVPMVVSVFMAVLAWFGANRGSKLVQKPMEQKVPDGDDLVSK